MCLLQEHFQRFPREGKSSTAPLFVSLLKSSTAWHLELMKTPSVLPTLYWARAISIPYTDCKDERTSRMTTGRVGGLSCAGCFLGTWLKMWLWHLQTAMSRHETNQWALKELSVLMLYSFSAAVTMKSNMDEVGKPSSKEWRLQTSWPSQCLDVTALVGLVVQHD